MPQDPVADRLRAAPVPDAIKASAWDAYEQATDEDDLARRLKALPLPDSVRADLWDLKAQGGVAVAPEPDAAPATPQRGWLDTAKDVGTGLVQSGVGAFVNAGEFFHKIPGVSSAVDALYGTPGVSRQAFTEAQAAVTPQNTPQMLGKLAGDIGMVIAPGTKITQLGNALAKAAPRGLQTAARIGTEAVGGGSIAALQGGDPTTGAVLSGAIPVVGKAGGAVASRLKAAVPEHVMKALGPTKEKYKAIAEKITPEIIKRRLGGSREALREQAGEAASEAGRRIDEALTSENIGGRVVGVQPIQDALEQVKQRYINIIREPVEVLTDAPAAAATTKPAGLPASFQKGDATEAELFADVLSDAKRQGYRGSPAELKTLFDDAMRDVKDYAADVRGSDRGRELLESIAAHGGIGPDSVYPGEVAHLWESSTGVVIPQKWTKSGRKMRKRELPSGAVSGVSGVVRKSGKSLDAMREALEDDGVFKFETVNEMLTAIDEAISSSRTGSIHIPKALQQFGVRPGEKWWQAADEGFDVAALEAGEQAAESISTTTPKFRERPVILDRRAVRQIEGLQDTLKQHGDSMRVDQLVALRRVWDEVVSQAGGYAHRAPGAIGMPLKDATEAWAKRKATTAIRQLLDAEVPELSALNKEFSFWKSLDDVLSQTLKRTAPQGPGLKQIAAEGTGRLIGAGMSAGGGLAAGVGKIWALGKVARLAEAAFMSPRWQFASARLKDDLAEAIMAGNVNKTATTLARIVSAQGSKVPAAVGAQ